MLLNSDEIKNTDMEFKEFLSKLEMDFETYTLANRSSLTQSKLFLK